MSTIEFAQPGRGASVPEERLTTQQTNGFQMDLARAMGVENEDAMIEWIGMHAASVHALIETNAKLRDNIRAGRWDEAIAFVKSQLVH